MSQVVIGKLETPKQLHDDMGQTLAVMSWDYRAMWSWLRFQFTRKIDSEIKKKVSEPFKHDRELRLEKMKELFNYHVLAKQSTGVRPMQYILTQYGRVVAVASLKHLLVPPQKVYDTAQEILQTKGLNLTKEEGIYGSIVYLGESTGLRLGLQIYGGTVTTRMAIRVASFIRVQSCFNPVSWLGVGSFRNWAKLPSSYFRILRIKKITELKLRLETAITRSRDNFADIEYRVGHTKKIAVSSPAAKVITSAMSISYGLGAKTITQVLDRYDEEEPQTQWGLAMALSWVARNGDFSHPFTGEPSEKTTQKLSTISGAILLIDDIKEAEAKSYDWLKEHIVEGKIKTIDELLADLNIH